MSAGLGRALCAAVVTVAVAWGAYAVGESNGHVHNGMPDIPRCVSDDFNDGSQDRCWTESPAGVIVIDSADRVVSVGGE